MLVPMSHREAVSLVRQCETWDGIYSAMKHAYSFGSNEEAEQLASGLSGLAMSGRTVWGGKMLVTPERLEVLKGWIAEDMQKKKDR